MHHGPRKMAAVKGCSRGRFSRSLSPTLIPEPWLCDEYEALPVPYSSHYVKVRFFLFGLESLL